MHKLLLALATFLLAVAPNLQAQDLSSGPVPLAYFNMPFGGTAKSMPSYGLQLARVEQDRTGGVNLFASTPIADLKFNGSELEAFNLNRVNTLQKVTRYNANGEAETSTEVNWWLVGGAVIVAGYLINR
ncbi:MAG: hypothetical protein GY934_00005, partial [Gammaproteobacteria bacterium]|nr:hypothetical protein [Gammaproteobacteria bacterium]